MAFLFLARRAGHSRAAALPRDLVRSVGVLSLRAGAGARHPREDSVRDPPTTLLSGSVPTRRPLSFGAEPARCAADPTVRPLSMPSRRVHSGRSRPRHAVQAGGTSKERLVEVSA